MKFRDVALGTRATKTIPLPLVHEPGGPDKAPSPLLAIRVLSGEETAEIIDKALDYARRPGKPEPKAGDPLYELGIRVHTLHLACVDPDAPNPESPDARFFSSIDEILGSHLIGRDVIYYLYEAYEAWQDHCAPQPREIDGTEFWAKITELAKSNDPLAFERYRPATRWNLARSMAILLLNSLAPKSPSGSASDSSGANEKSEPSPGKSDEATDSGEAS